MIFGMSSACFFPHTYNEQTVGLMANMNIKNIEVFFCCLSEYNREYIRELKNKLSDHGVKVYSIHALSLQFEPQLFSQHQRARQDSLDIYQQVLEAGAELGAGVYVFHGPGNLKRARSFSVNFEHTAQYTDPLADMAMGYGIKLAWENVHWCWYAQPDFPSRLLPLLTSDNLYFTLDVKQAAQAGHDPSDYLAATRGRLVNIHLCDYEISEEYGIVPRLPFQGTMDLGRFRKDLREIGYDNGMILEVYSHNYTDYSELENCYNAMVNFFSHRG